MVAGHRVGKVRGVAPCFLSHDCLIGFVPLGLSLLGIDVLLCMLAGPFPLFHTRQ